MGSGSSRRSRAKSTTGAKNETLVGHTGGINCMDISESGNLLITGSDDRTARVWDLLNFDLKVVLEGHSGYVTCCKFLQERYALTGSMDKTIRKWNTYSGNCILKMEDHRGKVSRILLRGYLLFSASYDRTIICWNVQDGQPVRVFRGHKQGVLPICYIRSNEHDPRGEEEINRNKDILISGSMDCTARLWSINAGSTLVTFRGHEGAILCLATNIEHTHLFTGSADYSIKMWKLDGGLPLKSFEGHEGSVIAIEISRKFMYSGSIDGTVRCWVTEFADSTRKYCAHDHMISDMKYHNGFLTTSSGDSTLKIFDAKSGSLKRTLKGHKYAVNCFMVSNTVIISASYDGTARIWNIQDLLKEKISDGIDDGSDISSQSSSVFMSSPPQTPDDGYCEKVHHKFPRSDKLSSSDTIEETETQQKMHPALGL